MIDIFSAVIGLGSICALTGAILKILLSPPKNWEYENWELEEIEGITDYDELRKENPHIWMD